MPITFSVTCDTDAELAQFLENLKFGTEFALAAARKRGSKTPTKAPKKVKVAKAISTTTKKKTATPKKATTAKSKTTGLKSKLKPAAAKKATKPKKVVKATTKKSSGAARKPGKLIPIINSAIQEMIKKGKPFRSKEVVDSIVKRTPSLNASSVTTGVSKLLSESKLKSEQIKDAIGRPYRLYKP